jgi:hypothetical protein
MYLEEVSKIRWKKFAKINKFHQIASPKSGGTLNQMVQAHIISFLHKRTGGLACLLMRSFQDDAHNPAHAPFLVMLMPKIHSGVH